MADWTDDPEARAWLEHVLDDVVPMMENSAVVVSLMPDGPSDIKFAVETGLALMMDKPIVLAVAPGTRVPDKLRRVADRIIEYDMSDPRRMAERVRDTAEAVLRERGES